MAGELTLRFLQIQSAKYDRFTVGSPASIDASVLQAALYVKDAASSFLKRNISEMRRCIVRIARDLVFTKFPLCLCMAAANSFRFKSGCRRQRKVTNRELSRSHKTPDSLCSMRKRSKSLHSGKVGPCKGHESRMPEMQHGCVGTLHGLMPSMPEALWQGRSACEPVGGTIASALAMRLARYSASDTYYPQTISILRLDKPQLTSVDDEISSTLRRLLPQSRRPDSAGSTSDRLKALSERMKAAESAGDSAEQARLLATILEIAQGKGQGSDLAETGLLSAVSQDLEKAIKESLAFRGTVSIEPAEAKALREGGTAELLAQEVA